MADTPLFLAGYNILIEAFPRDLEFRVNMASSGWMDVEEGVAGGQMAVQVVSTQEPDFEDTLLERLDNTSEKKAVGGAVRWALVINDHNSIDIMLQGLPLPKNFILSKPNLRGDNVPVIELWRHQISCNMFDGQRAAGPVPVLCVSSAEEADWVASHPTLMHAELVKMYGCLFKPEFITRNEAVGKLKPACYLFSPSFLAFRTILKFVLLFFHAA